MHLQLDICPIYQRMRFENQLLPETKSTFVPGVRLKSVFADCVRKFDAEINKSKLQLDQHLAIDCVVVIIDYCPPGSGWLPSD